MAWYSLFNKQEEPKIDMVVDTKYQNFSTPFGQIGKGNLSLPYVRAYSSAEPYIRFGTDNLYPQLINQMYQQSPLNGAIINFKRNAVIGGGWEINSMAESATDKVKEYTFIKKNKLKKLMHQATLDLIMHGRITIIVNEDEKGNVTFKRVGPETVRNNEDSTIYTISNDWSRQIDLKQYRAYKVGIKGESLFEYAPSKGEAGQSIYSIPQYCSALNSAFLNGEIPFLQKSNLINSIFPSLMLTMAKKFASQEEAEQFRNTIEKAKGPQEAGRILAFVTNDKEQLPEITPIPTNNNDKLFTETIDEVKASICTAHNIDMLIMGLRTPGKLGSGAELPQAYAIFEKNVVLPLREQMEEFGDELLSIGNIAANIKLNSYKIIDNVVVEQTNTSI